MSFLGSFQYVCSQAPLSLCPLVNTAIEPQCYSRNIEVQNTIVFEPALLVVLVVFVAMLLIMISHVRSKYTAVGRSEMLFWLYMLVATTVLEFFTVSALIPMSTSAYLYAVAIYISLSVASFWALFLNGLVPFQFVEDGTAASLWTLRVSTIVVFLVSLLLSVGAFTNLFGVTALWVIYFVFPLLLVIAYFISQFILLRSIGDIWAISDLAVGFVFYFLSQIFHLLLSPSICNSVNHYMDGLFFGDICMLLAVMMVYKYWDGLTQEDLEFAVSGKAQAWEIKDPQLSDGAMKGLLK